MRSRPVRPARRIGCALLFAVFAGCSPANATAAGEAAVRRHHELYDAERFGVMYTAADAELKAAVTDSQFVSLARGLYGKLGPTAATRRTGTTLNLTLFGSRRVALRHETQFQDGPGTEEFVFRVRGSRATLVRWNVSSPVFLQE